jgi:rubrerythrin
MAESADTIRQILRKAYQIEVDGHTFYSMASDQASKPVVQELFDKLAKDEIEHKAYLAGIASAYEREGTAAFLVQRSVPELKAFTSTIFTEQFKEQAKGATFEMGALSIGLQLESNAIAYFTKAAKDASEEEVREFYLFLADWEQEHYDALQSLHQAVKEDFWAASGFSPF